MADLTALQAAVARLVAEDASVKTALDDLAAKIANGDPATQADIDAITAQLTGVSNDIDAAIATDDPAPSA